MLLVKFVEQSPCLAAGDQALQTSTDVTLTGGNFEVTVDDANENVSMSDTIITDEREERRGSKLTLQQAGYQYHCPKHPEGRKQQTDHQCRHHRRRQQWG